jgi:hypothetical protein
MSVIQLEIDDTFIQQVGAKTVEAFMERQLSLLRLQYQGEHIAHEIQQSGIDHQHKVSQKQLTLC